MACGDDAQGERETAAPYAICLPCCLPCCRTSPGAQSSPGAGLPRLRRALRHAITDFAPGSIRRCSPFLLQQHLTRKAPLSHRSLACSRRRGGRGRLWSRTPHSGALAGAKREEGRVLIFRLLTKVGMVRNSLGAAVAASAAGQPARTRSRRRSPKRLVAAGSSCSQQHAAGVWAQGTNRQQRGGGRPPVDPCCLWSWRSQPACALQPETSIYLLEI